MVRFIHVADIHLDSPLRGLDRYEGAPVEQIRMASRRALANLVRLAIDQEVQFVLIAGDVFDGDWPDVNTGLYFVQQMGQLRHHGIPVYLVSGNHDAANKMTRHLPYPDNVHSFATDLAGTVLMEEIRVAIHGQSYAEQKEMRNLMAGYPAPVSGYLNIGLLHTGLDGREGHERYAPCQLAELIAHGFDYWALGHIHQRESVNSGRHPHVEFPGNIQGRHIRETGPKGCLVVDVDTNRHLSSQFHCLDVLRWAVVKVDCTNAEAGEQVLNLVAGAVDDVVIENPDRTVAVRVELAGKCSFHDALIADQRQFRDKIRSQVVGRGDDNVWIEKLVVRTSRPGAETTELGLADDAISELTEVISELSHDCALLQSLMDTADVRHLNGRLPADLKHGLAAIRLTDPAWALQLLDRAQSILTSAAVAKESAAL